jgi:HNH endonuclease
LNARTAAEITGLTVEVMRFDKHLFRATGADETGTVVAVGMGSEAKFALASLVEANYNRVRKLVLARDGWRCTNCGALSNLQAHHKVFRSHGRRDTLESLTTLCNRCHDQLHSRTA